MERYLELQRLVLFFSMARYSRRYKQTAIGVLWSVIRPLLTIFVMWFIGWLFGSNVPEGVPRILLVCAATLPWQFFSSSFSESSNSLIANSNLLTKVYFPRLIVPVLAQTNMKKIKNINPLGFFDDEFLLEMFTKPGYPLQKLVYMKCPKT